MYCWDCVAMDGPANAAKAAGCTELIPDETKANLGLVDAFMLVTAVLNMLTTKVSDTVESSTLVAAVVPSVIIHGFHPTGTHGPMGAAAAVANLLQFTPAQATSAIAIAASCAGGLMEFSQDQQGMMVKRFHAGRAAEAGGIGDT